MNGTRHGDGHGRGYNDDADRPTQDYRRREAVIPRARTCTRRHHPKTAERGRHAASYTAACRSAIAGLPVSTERCRHGSSTTGARFRYPPAGRQGRAGCHARGFGRISHGRHQVRGVYDGSYHPSTPTKRDGVQDSRAHRLQNTACEKACDPFCWSPAANHSTYGGKRAARWRGDGR